MNMFITAKILLQQKKNDLSIIAFILAHFSFTDFDFFCKVALTFLSAWIEQNTLFFCCQ